MVNIVNHRLRQTDPDTRGGRQRRCAVCHRARAALGRVRGMTATTGTAALAAARDAELMVLDINLPDIDGFEVCRRLRASPETARLPVLHLSATFTQDEDRAIGLRGGSRRLPYPAGRSTGADRDGANAALRASRGRVAPALERTARRHVAPRSHRGCAPWMLSFAMKGQ